MKRRRQFVRRLASDVVRTPVPPVIDPDVDAYGNPITPKKRKEITSIVKSTPFWPAKDLAFGGQVGERNVRGEQCSEGHTDAEYQPGCRSCWWRKTALAREAAKRRKA